MRTDRLEAVARELAAGEADRGPARQAARDLAERLREEAAAAVGRFAAVAGAAGAPHLDLLTVGPVEPDDKSVRAFQFLIRRGRWTVIVVSKDRGEVMLVGPFKRGDEEGPCHPIRFEEDGPDMEGLGREIETLLINLVREAFSR